MSEELGRIRKLQALKQDNLCLEQRLVELVLNTRVLKEMFLKSQIIG